MTESTTAAVRRRVATLLLLLAGLPQLATGAWALAAPHSWYTDFPGLGHHWVAALGPYDDHLVTDAGAGILAVGVLLTLAALLRAREVRLVACAGALAFAVPHFIFHVGTTDRLTTTDDVANLAALALAVLLPVVALLVDPGIAWPGGAGPDG